MIHAVYMTHVKDIDTHSLELYLNTECERMFTLAFE